MNQNIFNLGFIHSWFSSLFYSTAVFYLFLSSICTVRKKLFKSVSDVPKNFDTYFNGFLFAFMMFDTIVTM